MSASAILQESAQSLSDYFNEHAKEISIISTSFTGIGAWDTTPEANSGLTLMGTWLLKFV